eukprot:5414378-Pleurochrysis_carterae.AAC.2
MAWGPIANGGRSEPAKMHDRMGAREQGIGRFGIGRGGGKIDERVYKKEPTRKRECAHRSDIRIV